jgi:hypothetical protein
MPLRALLRSSPATYALPLLIGFILIPLHQDLSTWLTAHYWPSATGGASLALRFVGPACAAVAAWEGARLARGRSFHQAPARSPLAIAAPALLPVVIMGAAGMATALVASAAAADVGAGLPDFGVLAVGGVLLLANTLVGFIAGRVLHPLIAVPLVLISSYIVNDYPATFDIPWLRYLVGEGLDSCCAVDEVLDTRALVSAGVFATAVCLAAAVLIQRRGERLALFCALALLAGGTGLGWYSARNVGYEAVRARPSDSLICDGSQPQICLWPELGDRADMVRSQARKTVARLQNAGIQVPGTLTMAAKPGPMASKLGISSDTDAAHVPSGVASGLLPTEAPACARQGKAYPGEVAYGPVAAWLYTIAGEPSGTVAGRFGDKDTALAQAILKQPRGIQLIWYQRNMKALLSCGVEPQLALRGGTG